MWKALALVLALVGCGSPLDSLPLCSSVGGGGPGGADVVCHHTSGPLKGQACTHDGRDCWSCPHLGAACAQGDIICIDNTGTTDGCGVCCD